MVMQRSKLKAHYRSMLKLIDQYIGQPKTGAEIGVYLGKTAPVLHHYYPDLVMTFVDLWKEWPPDSNYGRNHGWLGRLTEKEWEAVYEEAMRNIRPLGDKAQIHRTTSQQAAELSKDKSFDFVFLDADHTYLGVKKDIELWLPKTKKILIGHDYGSKWDKAGSWGVTRAVREAFDTNIITLPGYIWAVVL